MQPKYYGAAANYNKPTGGSSGLGGIFKIFGIFVGAIIVIAIGFSIVNGISKGPQDNFARLVARQGNLLKLMTKQKDSIRGSDLRTINATATLLATGDSSILTKQLTSVFGADGVPDTVAAAEADTTTDATLKNATLIGTFDKTYAGILRDKIAATYDLANSVSGAASSDAVKTSTKQVMANLTAINDQLAKLKL